MKKRHFKLYLLLLFSIITSSVSGFYMTLPEDGHSNDLIIYLDDVPLEFDTLKTISFAQWTVLYNLVDRVFEFDADSKITPFLADGPSINKSGKEIEVRYAGNHFFHDGSKMSIDDIIYSLKLSASQSVSYGRLGSYLDCPPFSSIDKCNAIEKVDDTTLKINLKNPSHDFFEVLNMNENSIRSKEASEQSEFLYSGPYMVNQVHDESLLLSANKFHKKYTSKMFDNISIQQISPDIDRMFGKLSTRPSVLISKSTAQFIKDEPLKKGLDIFLYSSGTTFLLSLSETLEHTDYIKWAFQKVIQEGRVLKKYPYLRPANAFFPEGSQLHYPIYFDRVPPPETTIDLKVKYPVGMMNRELLLELSGALVSYSLNVEFLEVDQQTYNESLEDTFYQGMLAGPYVGEQDRTRVTKLYFSGYWPYSRSLHPGLIEKLEQASNAQAQVERAIALEEFHRRVFHESGLMPLIFSPNLIILNDSISTKYLEHKGNTIKFETIRSRAE